MRAHRECHKRPVSTFIQEIDFCIVILLVMQKECSSIALLCFHASPQPTELPKITNYQRFYEHII
uniref:Uncharacterized protein n=1 Tax=Arundo donax TaxID=35708 RepID=A0A0A9C3G9_ARUDO